MKIARQMLWNADVSFGPMSGRSISLIVRTTASRARCGRSATDSFQSLLMVFLLLAEDCAADPRKRSFVAPARIAPLN
jgi:hypothetical protein